MSQADDILQYLREHPEGISAIEAMEKFGCMRLAARISDIRAAGHEIIAENESHQGGTHARYKLQRDADRVQDRFSSLTTYRQSPHYRFRHWRMLGERVPGCMWCAREERIEQMAEQDVHDAAPDGPKLWS